MSLETPKSPIKYLRNAADYEYNKGLLKSNIPNFEQKAYRIIHDGQPIKYPCIMMSFKEVDKTHITIIIHHAFVYKEDVDAFLAETESFLTET